MTELERMLAEAVKTYNELSVKKQEAEALLYKINEDLTRVQKLVQTLMLACSEDNRFNNNIEQELNEFTETTKTTAEGGKHD